MPIQGRSLRLAKRGNQQVYFTVILFTQSSIIGSVFLLYKFEMFVRSSESVRGW